VASTRNGRLAKLAVGIASAAALAGLAGRFSTQNAAREAAAPEADRSGTYGPVQGWAAATWDEDEDDWWHDHDDHDDHDDDDDEKEHRFSRFLAKPERHSGETAPPAAVPRTRTGRS